MTEFSFRLISIDLTSGEKNLQLLPPDEVRPFLGGAGLGAYLLYSFLLPTLDPLSSDAPLLILTGPLTGMAGLSVGRHVLCAKSPLTNLWGESNSGGFFGPELRATGYDGLFITGCAPEPVYLWILNEKVEIRSASHLWGVRDTYETQSEIREELGDPLIRVACIGLAGESEIPFASVMCDHGKAAGRTGMGAVMGSKRLKAIAVKGNTDLPVAKPEQFNRERGIAIEDLREDIIARTMREVGTASGVDYFEYLGLMPKYYFSRGIFEGASKVSGATVAETILRGVSKCHTCTIACSRVVRLKDGQDRKGPEYETTVGFGPNLGIDDIAAITMAGEWCDRYGMDTISLSNTMGFAFLLYEEGILTERETGGEKLNWGDSGVVERLIHLTAKKEGFGELLARGVQFLGEHFEVPEKAAHVNGLEVPYHDPRGASGMALVYATSPRGACHNQSDYYFVDVLGNIIEEIGITHYDRFAGAEKAANVARHQDWRTLGNNLVLCMFANIAPRMVLNLINGVTNFEYGQEELIKVGERSWNLKRVINHRLGLKQADDRLPAVLLQPLSAGGSAGYGPPMQDMLTAYYQVRGWDSKTGRPSPDRLRSLNLDKFIPDIWDN